MVLKNDNNMLLKDRVVECVVAHENVAHENTFFLEKQTHIFATDIVQRFVWGCAELRFGEATSNL